MSVFPRVPQPTAIVSVGDAALGSEVINARVVVDDRLRGVELRCSSSPDAPSSASDSPQVEWVVGVPHEAHPDHDLTDSQEFYDDGWRAAGGTLVRRVATQIAGHPVKAKKHILQVHVPAGASATNVQSLVIGLIVGNHQLVVKKKPDPRVAHINIVCGNTDPSTRETLVAAVANGERLAQATCLARDLANMPSNVKSPEWLANKAVGAVEDLAGVKVRVRNKSWLKAKGFGGILAVGSGSSNKPVLVEMEWDPERVGQRRRRKSVLLVGKGVTFDTGGISIKPAAGMGSMRTDMSGGASVLAAFRALAQMQVPRRVVAIIPMAENMVDGKSFRPGDVVEHYGGMTTEIANTDAEGRLLLADAVAYGTKRYKPSNVVTVATLTGAAKVALGLRVGAVFAPTWGKGVKLARRGAVVGERWWPMPMPDYLEDKVDSALADVHQTPAGPGAITAAMFVRRFAKNVPLYHLDIAGPGRAEATFDEVGPLGTGFGARTLINWLAR